MGLIPPITIPYPSIVSLIVYCFLFWDQFTVLQIGPFIWHGIAIIRGLFIAYAFGYCVMLKFLGIKIKKIQSLSHYLQRRKLDRKIFQYLSYGITTWVSNNFLVCHFSCKFLQANSWQVYAQQKNLSFFIASLCKSLYSKF